MNSFCLDGCKEAWDFIFCLKEWVMIPWGSWVSTPQVMAEKKIYGVVEELSKWDERDESETI